MKRFLIDFEGEEEFVEPPPYKTGVGVRFLPPYLIPYSEDVAPPTRVAKQYLEAAEATVGEMWLVHYRIQYNPPSRPDIFFTPAAWVEPMNRYALGTTNRSIVRNWYWEDTTIPSSKTGRRRLPSSWMPPGSGVSDLIIEVYSVVPAPWW